MTAYQRPQFLEAEPGHLQTGLNGGLAERLQEERFSGAAGSTYNQIFMAADPLQGAQCGLGGGWNGGESLVPGGEGLAGRESGFDAAGGQRRTLTSSDLLIQQQLEYFGRIPTLRTGGGQHLWRSSPHVRQPHATQQRIEFGRQWRRHR